MTENHVAHVLQLLDPGHTCHIWILVRFLELLIASDSIHLGVPMVSFSMPSC